MTLPLHELEARLTIIAAILLAAFILIAAAYILTHLRLPAITVYAIIISVYAIILAVGLMFQTWECVILGQGGQR